MRRYKITYNSERERYEFIDNTDNSVIFAHAKESWVKHFAKQYRRVMR